MSTAQELDGLLVALEATVKETLEYFEGPGATSTAMVGDWGPKEVLCHYLFWHEATARGIESVVSGGGPRTPEGTTDELNARVVEQHAGESIPQLVAQARDLQERLVRAARQLSDLDVVVIHRTGSPPSTARQRLERIPKHWQDHMAQMQA